MTWTSADVDACAAAFINDEPPPDEIRTRIGRPLPPEFGAAVMARVRELTDQEAALSHGHPEHMCQSEPVVFEDPDSGDQITAQLREKSDGKVWLMLLTSDFELEVVANDAITKSFSAYVQDEITAADLGQRLFTRDLPIEGAILRRFDSLDELARSAGWELPDGDQ